MSQGRTALITGISGQDGPYLAQFLIEKGYCVHGTTRSNTEENLQNLRALALNEKITLHEVVSPNRSVLKSLISDLNPDHIYNLTGQSSVGKSFAYPVETIESNLDWTLNLLETIRTSKSRCRFFNAGSSECFGDTTEAPADELTPFHPHSPYGVGKTAATWVVRNYRHAFGIYACSGILFNHESPLRPAQYVTQKIVRGAADIKLGLSDVLELGNLGISRDWGWAPDYVDAMFRMLDYSEPHDFVICTGRIQTLKQFVTATFHAFDLDPHNYVRVNPALLRPDDVNYSVGKPAQAKRLLGWEATVTGSDVARRLVRAEMRRRGMCQMTCP